MIRAVYCPPDDGPPREVWHLSDAYTFAPPSPSLVEEWQALTEDTTMVRTPQAFLDSVIQHWGDALFSEQLTAEGWRLLALRTPHGPDLWPSDCPSHPEFFQTDNLVAVAEVEGQIVAVKCRFRPAVWHSTPEGVNVDPDPSKAIRTTLADPSLRIWWYVIVGEARKLL